MPFAVDLSNVTKTYGRKIKALRGVDIRIPQGAVFGLLGPNGAGKSTLVKIMMTVIRPTTCSGTILGNPVGDKETLSRLGYLPEHHRFPDYLTGQQVVDHFGALAGVPRGIRLKRTEELIELVGLTPWKKNRIREYSKGMRQRVGIAQALVSDPELVLLDEPTDGVDPVGRRDIRNVLMEQKRRGRTVLLNSHLLSELEMVCDTVALMVQGKVVQQGTVSDLTTYGARYSIEIVPPQFPTVDGPFTPNTLRDVCSPFLRYEPEPLPPRRQWQPNEPNALVWHAVLTSFLPANLPVEVSPTTIVLGTDDPNIAQPFIDILRARGLAIRSARSLRPGLEDLFMRAVTDESTGRVLGPGANLDASSLKPRSENPPMPASPAAQSAAPERAR